jgi:hypothetical protein
MSVADRINLTLNAIGWLGLAPVAIEAPKAEVIVLYAEVVIEEFEPYEG